MARDFERNTSSARRYLRDLLDSTGEVPGIHQEDPLYTMRLQPQDIRGAVSLEDSLVDTPAQEEEDSPQRAVLDKLEDIRSQVKEGPQHQPAAKKPKQGSNKDGTPNIRPKRTGGRKGH